MHNSNSNNRTSRNLIPNHNVSHPSLAPVDISALRRSLFPAESQQSDEGATTHMEASTSGLNANTNRDALLDTDNICMNKICKRVREDLSKKWCEQCRARQQRKIARQRMKAKMKKEAEQRGTSHSQAVATRPQSQAAPEDPVEGMSRDTETSGTSEVDVDAPMDSGEEILDSVS